MWSSTCYGQPDHLQPVDGIFDAYPFSLKYHLKVRELLLDSIPGVTEFQFIALHSWGPEQVLLIKRIGDNNYEIYAIMPNKSIWYSHQEDKTPNLTIFKHNKVIDPENVELLKNLCESALKNIRIHDDENWTPDVSSFYFSVNKRGLRTGTTKSPMEGTNMAELITLMYKLIDLTEHSSSGEFAIDEIIKAQIEELKEKISK